MKYDVDKIKEKLRKQRADKKAKVGGFKSAFEKEVHDLVDHHIDMCTDPDTDPLYYLLKRLAEVEVRLKHLDEK